MLYANLRANQVKKQGKQTFIFFTFNYLNIGMLLDD